MENGEEEEKGRDDAMDGDGAGKAGADDPMVAAVKKFETILGVVEKKMVEFEATWREKVSDVPPFRFVSFPLPSLLCFPDLLSVRSSS